MPSTVKRRVKKKSVNRNTPDKGRGVMQRSKATRKARTAIRGNIKAKR